MRESPRSARGYSVVRNDGGDPGSVDDARKRVGRYAVIPDGLAEGPGRTVLDRGLPWAEADRVKEGLELADEVMSS